MDVLDAYRRTQRAEDVLTHLDAIHAGFAYLVNHGLLNADDFNNRLCSKLQAAGSEAQLTITFNRGTDVPQE